ncbi:uncharacterized protein LOC143688437 [Tamandua tetradactyla]|uniref:uncharacterized protein LOC143688437 n=1 Tax=Tamandua tetradactyla TaxID=48850 RepID=UPI004054986E
MGRGEQVPGRQRTSADKSTCPGPQFPHLRRERCGLLRALWSARCLPGRPSGRGTHCLEPLTPSPAAPREAPGPSLSFRAPSGPRPLRARLPQPLRAEPTPPPPTPGGAGTCAPSVPPGRGARGGPSVSIPHSDARAEPLHRSPLRPSRAAGEASPRSPASSTNEIVVIYLEILHCKNE